MLVPALANAEEGRITEEAVTGGIYEIVDAIDLKELEEYYAEYGFLGEGSMADAVKEISVEGLSALSPDDALKSLWEIVGAALRQNTGTAVQLVIMMAVTGVLNHLQSSFGKDGVSNAASRAGYIVVCGLAVSMLAGTVLTARQSMDKLFKLAELLTPVLVTLLTGISGGNSAAMMSPTMAALTGSVAGIMKNAVFPAILVSAVIGVVSNLSTTVRLGKTSALIASGVKWALGFIMVVFLGVTAMKGLAASAIDGISLKTAKYTVGQAIPYVGRMFSDSLDTIMACGVIVKNAVGIAGLIMMAAVMAAPLMKVVVSMFLFKAAAAAAQPFAEVSAVKMLSDMGETAKLTATVLLTSAAMVFITVALFIGAADMSLMLR